MSALLVIFIFVLYIRSKIQQRKNIEKFKQILRKSNIKNSADSPVVLEKVDISVHQAGNNEAVVLMSSETEEKLLAKLNKFEKSNLFNNKNISLPFLAGRFETNTKYLSYVINTHREKDFNNYINELRINYIIEKRKMTLNTGTINWPLWQKKWAFRRIANSAKYLR
jgi:YesN/AraC family two-component response regulator